MRKLIVVTGLSGSGKSSLAFDTLYAEGQRRYIETFSPYARQFFDRMDKPRVDSIEGIPPAIALEQRNTVKTTRSTVGTMTEVCDYMKVLWPHMAQLTCRGCGKPVRKDSPGAIWEEWAGEATGSGFGDTALPAKEALVLFDVPLATGFGVEESLQFIRKQAYSRLWIDDEVVRLEDVPARLKARAPAFLTVVQDRLKFDPVSKRRGVEAFEQAFHFGKGKIALQPVGGGDLRGVTPNHLHCASCDISYREPSPALFSFNNPVGACPTCKGFGRVVTIDYESAIPNRSLTLAQGAVKPWQTATGKESQQDMAKFCKTRKVPMDVPFEKLSAAHQKWVMDGDPDYGKDAAHQWPKAWYGVKGYFRWMESQSYKMHMRVLLSRYRAYVTCESCKGLRFQPEALQYRVAVPNGPAMALPEFYRLTVSGARAWIDDSAARTLGKGSMAGPVELALKEVRSRLAYLEEVGLGYLTLDRSTRSLSGGETQRVNLTTCLGSRLVNTLFVLDEPSVGLHARDTARLVGILHRLRDSGNTLVVVEHEASVMRSADQIIDLGPGHGEQGGELIFQGTADEIVREPKSITGRYLAESTGFAVNRLPVDETTQWLILSGATLHNLNNLTVSLPLGRLVCITGVSGSGKTTLVRHILHPPLVARLNAPASVSVAAETDAEDEEQEGGSASRAVRVTGHESLGSVLMVDQSSLGRTPRSNPVVYIGAFDHVRDLFAEAPLAKQRGLSAGSFSFNSAQGQCDRCRGLGSRRLRCSS